MKPSILLIDHYDSFTHTIHDYLQQLKVRSCILQFDDPELLNLNKINPTHIVLSPGPGHPADAKQTVQLIQDYHRQYPMLGICLGMQCIAYAFGGNVIHACEVMHGKQSLIYHQGGALYQNIPLAHHVTRYHSLMVETVSLSCDFMINAWTFDKNNQQIIMGIEHKFYPVLGVQYHPEAILSEHGLLLFENFLTRTQFDKRN